MIKMITNMVERALERLLIQFKESALFPLIASMIVEQVQEVEVELNEMINNRIIWDGETLEGVGITLDQWGALIGERRGSLSDLNFIRFIVARIARNTSSGTPEQLLNILHRLTQADEIIIREHPGATVSFEFSGGSLGALVVGELQQIMQTSTIAGVQVTGVVETHSNPFKLDTPDQGLDQGQLSRLV